MTRSIPGWKDKPLFTPGPLTTSRTVKQAMLRDLGSRDSEFIDVVREFRVNPRPFLPRIGADERGFARPAYPRHQRFARIKPRRTAKGRFGASDI